MALIGEHIVLRKTEKKDLKILMAYRNIPELRRYYRTKKELNYTDQENYFSNFVMSDSHHIFTILRNNNIIGEARLSYVDPLYHKAEIGIYVMKPQKGYGIDTLRLLIKFAFESLNLNRLEAEVADTNIASHALFKKGGFLKEGTKREATYYDGAYHDTILYSLLKKEYSPVQSQTVSHTMKYFP